MNLPNKRADTLVLLGDMRVRVRARVWIRGENRIKAVGTPVPRHPEIKESLLRLIDKLQAGILT